MFIVYAKTKYSSVLFHLICRVSGSWGYRCHSDCCSAGHVCDCGLDCYHSTKMFCFLKLIKSVFLPKYTLVESSPFLHACIFWERLGRTKVCLHFRGQPVLKPPWITARVLLHFQTKGLENAESNDCRVGYWVGGTARLTEKLLQASSSWQEDVCTTKYHEAHALLKGHITFMHAFKGTY